MSTEKEYLNKNVCSQCHLLTTRQAMLLARVCVEDGRGDLVFAAQRTRCLLFNYGRILEKNMEWQPIETAPKDGTEILVWFGCGDVPVAHIAWYRSKQEWENSGQYCGGWDSLEDWEGWWSYTTGSVSQEKLDGYRTPTHWTPYEAPNAPGKPTAANEPNKGENA